MASTRKNLKTDYPEVAKLFDEKGALARVQLQKPTGESKVTPVEDNPQDILARFIFEYTGPADQFAKEIQKSGLIKETNGLKLEFIAQQILSAAKKTPLQETKESKRASKQLPEAVAKLFEWSLSNPLNRYSGALTPNGKEKLAALLEELTKENMTHNADRLAREMLARNIITSTLKNPMAFAKAISDALNPTQTIKKQKRSTLQKPQKGKKQTPTISPNQVSIQMAEIQKTSADEELITDADRKPTVETKQTPPPASTATADTTKKQSEVKEDKKETPSAAPSTTVTQTIQAPVTLDELKREVARIKEQVLEEKNPRKLQRAFIENVVIPFEFFKDKDSAAATTIQVDIDSIRIQLGKLVFDEHKDNLTDHPLNIPPTKRYSAREQIYSPLISAIAYADRIPSTLESVNADKKKAEYLKALEVYRQVTDIAKNIEPYLTQSDEVILSLINKANRELYNKLEKNFSDLIQSQIHHHLPLELTDDHRGLLTDAHLELKLCLLSEKPFQISYKQPKADSTDPELEDDSLYEEKADLDDVALKLESEELEPEAEDKEKKDEIKADEDDEETEEQLKILISEDEKQRARRSSSSADMFTDKEEAVISGMIDQMQDINDLIKILRQPYVLEQDTGVSDENLTRLHMAAEDFGSASSSKYAMEQLDTRLPELMAIGEPIKHEYDRVKEIQSKLNHYINLLKASGLDDRTALKAFAQKVFPDERGYLHPDFSDAAQKRSDFLVMVRNLEGLLAEVNKDAERLHAAKLLYDKAIENYKIAAKHKKDHPDTLQYNADVIKKQLGLGGSKAQVHVETISYINADEFKTKFNTACKNQGVPIDPDTAAASLETETSGKGDHFAIRGRKAETADVKHDTGGNAVVITIKPESKSDVFPERNATIIVAGKNTDGSGFGKIYGRQFDRGQIFYDFLESQLKNEKERNLFSGLRKFDKADFPDGTKYNKQRDSSPFFDLKDVVEFFAEYTEFPPTKKGFEKFIKEKAEEKVIGPFGAFDEWNSLSTWSGKMFDFYMQKVFQPTSMLSRVPDYTPSQALINQCKEAIKGFIESKKGEKAGKLRGKTPETIYAMRAVLEAFKLMAKDGQVKIDGVEYPESVLKYDDFPVRSFTAPSSKVIEHVKNYLIKEYPAQRYKPDENPDPTLGKPLITAAQLDHRVLQQAATTIAPKQQPVSRAKILGRRASEPDMMSRQHPAQSSEPQKAPSRAEGHPRPGSLSHSVSASGRSKADESSHHQADKKPAKQQESKRRNSL